MRRQNRRDFFLTFVWFVFALFCLSIIRYSLFQVSNSPVKDTIKYVSEKIPSSLSYHPSDEDRNKNVEDVLSALRLSSLNHFCSKRPSQAGKRYKHLKTAIKGAYFMVAINFYNDQQVAPDFLIQFHELVQFIGPKNLYVSVYENGSNDQTKTYLGLLRMMLNAMDVEHSIEVSYDPKPINLHRIEYLASVRNRVMEPISKIKREILRVIFMNDVFYCADDIKELLYQSLLQGADLTCGLDFDSDTNGVGFYDTWVARDIHGRLFKKRPIYALTTDARSNDALAFGSSFQVQCCWNGVAILSANPFLPPHSIKFRKRKTTYVKASDQKYERLRNKFPRTVLYDDCSASEISTLCKDLQLAGYKKAIVVPRVKFGYDWTTYKLLKGTVYSEIDEFRPEEDKPIVYKKLPDTTVCHPMNQIGVRDPDGPMGEELLMIKTK